MTRKEIVETIFARVNNPNGTFGPGDAGKSLIYIESDRLSAEDFGITQEVFQMLLQKLEKVSKMGGNLHSHENKITALKEAFEQEIEDQKERRIEYLSDLKKSQTELQNLLKK